MTTYPTRLSQLSFMVQVLFYAAVEHLDTYSVFDNQSMFGTHKRDDKARVMYMFLMRAPLVS